MSDRRDFAEEKEQLLTHLRTLEEHLADSATKTEVDLTDLRQKLSQAVSAVSAERFSIALFGAFSEGKTSLAGALLGRSDLKVGPEPITDRITELLSGDYTIVDTPGLFPIGLMHEERTKKYISEANLILFVLPPQNPLKESHRAVITWLLNDLGKLPSTVFVVNKMDEVADVEDEEKFQESAVVRREVVVETLSRYLGKPVAPAVTCVAADPRQKGLAYWLNNPDEYNRLSRMSELRHVMNGLVLEARRTLILRAGFDVLREAQTESTGRIRKALQAVREQLKITSNARHEIGENVQELEDQSRKAWEGLMKEFENERKRLVLGIAAQSDGRRLATYVMAEIGKEGDELLRRVDRLITTHAEPLAGSARRKMDSINASVEFQKGAHKAVFVVVGKVSAGLAKWLTRQSNRGLADAMLKMNKAAKLSSFKPWGAVKLAARFKAFGKLLGVLGPILDVLGPVLDIWSEHKLNQKKTELTDEIDGFFREVRDQLTLPDLRDDCCPGLDEARKIQATFL